MRSPIPVANIEPELDLENLGLSQAKQILVDQLNIKIHLHAQNTDSFSDLMNPERCLVVLSEFQIRIQAVNLTCSASMFMKYWAVPLLFPYLYALLTEQIHLPWELSALSVQMVPTWYWDRHLNFKLSFLSLNSVNTQNYAYEIFILRVFKDLNQIFEVMSKVGKVQKFLLWENTALRILQFYDLMQRKDSTLKGLRKMKNQRQFLSDLNAEFFGLKQNPFLLLEQSRKLSGGSYQRKKCCFYFQLPEAENEYCASCPLVKKDQGRDQT
ncbi:(2Fe-2S)-binding protein [Acinetobacter sp. TGL-Y2]|uniref:(2Fe-2S)-binding protein n=1 Tax=Acinetobacter sp. TGL-Y2 TaxID=1407071 RepID=UPI0007A65FAF|nr:(2Fe-2S)-binding protein [Acinetobacter sp. TGL-Y2]AMW78119.1 (2Fe-2S)-binding protein [Acinetobacter sp. TGL-Y2]